MRKISIIIISFVFMIILASCEADMQPSNYKTTSTLGSFTIIEENNEVGNTYVIVKHDDTGVLYMISNYNQNAAVMTPILKADGTPYTIEDVRLKDYE